MYGVFIKSTDELESTDFSEEITSKYKNIKVQGVKDNDTIVSYTRESDGKEVVTTIKQLLEEWREKQIELIFDSLAERVAEKIRISSYSGWIPLNAIGGEPEEEGNYLVQFSDNIITTVYYNGKDFELWYDSPEPVAWMPLPKPYNTESEE